MFDIVREAKAGVTAADLHAWLDHLRTSTAPDDEVACVDLLDALEQLTCAAAGL